MIPENIKMAGLVVFVLLNGAFIFFSFMLIVFAWFSVFARGASRTLDRLALDDEVLARKLKE